MDLPMQFRAGPALPATVLVIRSTVPPDPGGHVALGMDVGSLPGVPCPAAPAQSFTPVPTRAPRGWQGASLPPPARHPGARCRSANAPGPSFGTWASGVSWGRAAGHHQLFSTSVTRKRTLSSAKGISRRP